MLASATQPAQVEWMLMAANVFAPKFCEVVRRAVAVSALNCRSVLVLCVAAAVGAWGCTNTQATSPNVVPADASFVDAGADLGADAAPTSDLPCAVRDVLASNCQNCHGSELSFGAPQSLVSYRDLTRETAPGVRVIDRVLARMTDTARPMPPRPNPLLGAPEQSVLRAWAAAPTQRDANTVCESRPPSKPEGLDCAPDLAIQPIAPYLMPTDKPDQYVCYGVDLDSAAKRHITSIFPKIDNRKIVHHVLLFESDNAVSSTPTPCDSGGVSMSWRMLYAWAPGGQPLELPKAAGFPLQGKKHYAVQLHYNNVKALVGETDTSGFELCSTNVLRPNDADVMAFGTHKLDIPARSNNYTVDCSRTASWPTKELHFFAAMPHMHQLGTSMSTTLIANGVETDLGKVTNWDFETQVWQPLDVLVRQGDTIRTRCSYVNPTGNNVRFGEKTADEMCYNFSMYYPRIASPWVWSLPAQTSVCK
jgi:cytochrome c5